MVGLGGANAGELVVGGRGVAFVCLEHFTGRVNPETYGMGLPPDLIPLWIGHELAHTVRYTSPRSASDMRRLVADHGGYYDYWSTGSRATLRELLVNEGLAVHAAQAVAPGLRRGRLLRLSPTAVSPAAGDGGVPPARGRAGPRAERPRPAAPLSLRRHEPVRPPGGRARRSRSEPATTSATA